MSRVLRTVVTVLTACLLAGCGTSVDEGDRVDGEQATAALERQRDDVRAVTAELLEGVAVRLPGTVRQASGSWRGCESGGLEEFRNFRYLAQSRVDAAPDARRPYLDAVRPVLDAAGFTPGEPAPGPGGGSARRIPATRGQLTATVSEVPDGGDYVLLTVSGECVDVPEDQRRAWLVRDDPTPIG